MNDIKQQKIKLNEDERNKTNNKNKSDELNNMLSVINRIYQFFSINVCRVNNQMNQIYQNGKSKQRKIQCDKKESSKYKN